MNNKVSNEENEFSEAQGNRRLNDKIKELKERNTTLSIDSEEPTGLLSGGPEHLDLEDKSDET